MVRSPCCDDSGGLKKGPWTTEEDDKLIKYINKHGHGSWRALPKLAGLNRCGKSCRLRWTNYLRPDIKRGKFSQEEEQTILNLHAILGNKWSAIATHLPGRTDNEIKNFWNTHLKKKLIQMGFDPMTHQPRTDIFSSLPHLIALANLIENPSAWEDRLQAEALQMARISHHLQSIILQPQQQPPLLPQLQPPLAAAGIPAGLPEPDFSLLSQLETGSGGGYLQESTPFSHLPDLQLPQAEVSAAAAQWMPPSFSTAETSLTNTGDGCSTSSYGGAQLWSQLLDDPLFNELP